MKEITAKEYYSLPLDMCITTKKSRWCKEENKKEKVEVGDVVFWYECDNTTPTINENGEPTIHIKIKMGIIVEEV